MQPRTQGSLSPSSLWDHFLPWGAGLQCFLSCPRLLVAEAKSWVCAVERCGLLLPPGSYLENGGCLVCMAHWEYWDANCSCPSHSFWVGGSMSGKTNWEDLRLVCPSLPLPSWAQRFCLEGEAGYKTLSSSSSSQRKWLHFAIRHGEMYA